MDCDACAACAEMATLGKTVMGRLEAGAQIDGDKG